MTPANDPSTPPPFFTDRTDPQLASYHDFIEQFREADGKVLDLRVTPEAVRTNDVNTVQFIVLAAQHHPDVLERLLFGVNFQFEDPAPAIPGALIDEGSWKSDPKVQKWLAHLHEVLPWGVYFAQDHDVRFYMLFGDILNRDRAALTIKPTRSGREKKIEMTGVQTQTFFNRLIQASVYLLHYCRPAGIVPQPAIEALLAEFDIEEHSGWNYERIYAHFQNEIATGFSMRATPGT